MIYLHRRTQIKIFLLQIYLKDFFIIYNKVQYVQNNNNKKNQTLIAFLRFPAYVVIIDLIKIIYFYRETPNSSTSGMIYHYDRYFDYRLGNRLGKKNFDYVRSINIHFT